VYDPTNPRIFWESGIHGPGIYRTVNGGSTFQVFNIQSNDFVSVDFNDPDRRTLVAGGHEASRTVWRSTDQGQTWTNVGTTIPTGTGYSSHPLVINPQTYVVNTDGKWGAPGIFRTTNGGRTWARVSVLGPSTAPLRTSNGTIFWVADGYLLRSSDGGATWIQEYGGFQDVTPVELPGGRLAAVGPFSLVLSTDGGTSWSALGPDVTFRPVSLAYSAGRKAFFALHVDCGDSALPHAVMQLELKGE
jgi:photosystem II stability/assembly factor-like uncharacterized protein